MLKKISDEFIRGILILSVVFAGYFYMEKRAEQEPKIYYVVDAKKITALKMEEIKKSILNNEIGSTAEVENRLSEFNQSLEKVINSTAISNNITIYAKGAVFSKNIVDLTAKVEEKVLRK